MAIIGTYNIPDHVKGDTFKDLQFTITINDVALDLTGYTIECKFRLNRKKGVETYSIDTTSGITITDVVNGVFKIDAFTCDWDVATYYYDIQFTDGSGIVSTFLEGKLEIIQDVTY